MSVIVVVSNPETNKGMPHARIAVRVVDRADSKKIHQEVVLDPGENTIPLSIWSATKIEVTEE